MLLSVETFDHEIGKVILIFDTLVKRWMSMIDQVLHGRDHSLTAGTQECCNRQSLLRPMSVSSVLDALVPTVAQDLQKETPCNRSLHHLILPKIRLSKTPHIICERWFVT